ncbi:MAG TPA: phosphoribosyltransferase domain-containing protein, partial [Actinomycetospora sp.]|uniref:phosphoribosyltransferase domain-containing protein n=1 Tax=Actinomycetospora sp. TaxID=1872135 RepID=UPI002F3E5B48
LEGRPGEDDAPGAAGLTDLVGLALRRNPRRAYLLVSRVIGKHVPCDPRLARAAGLVLGHRVGELVRASAEHPVPDHPAPTLPATAITDPRAAARARDAAVGHPSLRVPSIVLGCAENGAALGQFVGEALDADHVVASTRRDVPGAAVLGSFEEQHSHAGRHLLVPDDPSRWEPELPLVLVDDEMTTGRTAAATLRLLHHHLPRPRYVVAVLVDVRGPGDDAVERAAAELGVRVDVVALATGTLRVPDDARERAAALVARHPCPEPTAWGRGRLTETHLHLAGAPEGARHGVDRADRAALEAALPAAVGALAAALGPDAGRVLVLGTEELVHLPVRLAEGLAGDGRDVVVAATTRSPAVAVDVPGCALRSALPFRAHDAGLGTARERYAYDLGQTGRHDAIVLVVDSDAHTSALHGPDGLVPRLRALAPRVVVAIVPTRGPRRRATVVHAVPARRGPRFGTYARDEVAWLLEDLSAVPLEVGHERREREVREGRAHYSEALPEEHVPSPVHEEHFHRALARSATTVARLVGHVTDRLLATVG